MTQQLEKWLVLFNIEKKIPQKQLAKNCDPWNQWEATDFPALNPVHNTRTS